VVEKLNGAAAVPASAKEAPPIISCRLFIVLPAALKTDRSNAEVLPCGGIDVGQNA